MSTDFGVLASMITYSRLHLVLLEAIVVKVLSVWHLLVVDHIANQSIDIIKVLLVTTDMTLVLAHLADIYVRVLRGIHLFLSMVVKIPMLLTITDGQINPAQDVTIQYTGVQIQMPLTTIQVPMLILGVHILLQV